MYTGCTETNRPIIRQVVVFAVGLGVHSPCKLRPSYCELASRWLVGIYPGVAWYSTVVVLVARVSGCNEIGSDVFSAISHHNTNSWNSLRAAGRK